MAVECCIWMYAKTTLFTHKRIRTHRLTLALTHTHGSPSQSPFLVRPFVRSLVRFFRRAVDPCIHLAKCKHVNVSLCVYCVCCRVCIKCNSLSLSRCVWECMCVVWQCICPNEHKLSTSLCYSVITWGCNAFRIVSTIHAVDFVDK